MENRRISSPESKLVSVRLDVLNAWTVNSGADAVIFAWVIWVIPPVVASIDNRFDELSRVGTPDAVISLTSMDEPETNTFFQLAILFYVIVLLINIKLITTPIILILLQILGLK
mgnify:CR=1 FL=1